MGNLSGKKEISINNTEIGYHIVSSLGITDISFYDSISNENKTLTSFVLIKYVSNNNRDKISTHIPYNVFKSGEYEIQSILSKHYFRFKRPELSKNENKNESKYGSKYNEWHCNCSFDDYRNASEFIEVLLMMRYKHDGRSYKYFEKTDSDSMEDENKFY